MAQQVIRLTHFSDVLCVWAYIAQIRVDELRANFPDELAVDYHFFQVFADVPGKMASQWADRGGLDAYAAHVQDVAAGFGHISISPEAWLTNTPVSSMPAHLQLCALRAAAREQPDSVSPADIEALLKALRQAFFVDTRDLANRNVLRDITAEAGLDASLIDQMLDSGRAHAQLASDIALAASNGVSASPALMFNEGRQMLTGNVGYRVIEANVRELLHNPAEQQSWC